MTWSEVAAIIIAIIAIGGVVVGILKGFFQTKKVCTDKHNCDMKKIDTKLDKLEVQIGKNRDTVSAHYTDLSTALGRIEGQLKILNNRP
jgi:uncharacterized membrane-anchored protein YhcB (DUF1043 family)